MPWFKNRNFSAVFPDWKKRAVKQYFEKSKKTEKILYICQNQAK